LQRRWEGFARGRNAHANSCRRDKPLPATPNPSKPLPPFLPSGWSVGVIAKYKGSGRSASPAGTEEGGQAVFPSLVYLIFNHPRGCCLTAGPRSSLRHVVLWRRGGRRGRGGRGRGGGRGWRGGGAEDFGQVVHDAGLLGVHQVELPDENDEMCIQSVQVALQLQSHRLFKVRPVEVSQHVEQVPADLLHQGLEGVGELFAWRERRGNTTRRDRVRRHHEAAAGWIFDIVNKQNQCRVI